MGPFKNRCVKLAPHPPILASASQMPISFMAQEPLKYDNKSPSYCHMPVHSSSGKYHLLREQLQPTHTEDDCQSQSSFSRSPGCSGLSNEHEHGLPDYVNCISPLSLLRDLNSSQIFFLGLSFLCVLD